ncbi:HNH endonuclease [Burkholderia ambifaria]
MQWPSPIGKMFLANKAKGIHKPAGLEYALSIRQSLGGPYHDSVSELSDGSWQLHYAQEGSDPSYFTNRALAACMRDSIPIGVMIQVMPKPNPQYKVLGLGQVIDWNESTFTIRQFILNQSTTDSIDPEPLRGAFDIFDERDARIRTLRSIAGRRGQPAFRDNLIRAYGGVCAVTGCQVVETLEAAHILPYRGEHSNHVQNGLLLRADLHTLFDLGMFDIAPDSLVVRFDPYIQDKIYTIYDGNKLILPSNETNWPSRQALHARLVRRRVANS